MKNKFSSLVVRTFSVLALSFCVLALFSCQQPDSPAVSSPDVTEPLGSDSSLIGTWDGSTDEYTEKYVITSSSFSSEGGYAGNSLCVVYTDDDLSAGYLYFKYTKSMNPDWSYSESAPDVGKWYAVSFKDLTSSSIKISGAYKKDGKTSTDTLDEAISEFTIANGYFAYYSECVKK